MTPQETGGFIAKLRKEIGITQQELAEKLNVTAKAVSRWETGKGYPDVTILPKLSEFFDVSVNELLNGERCSKEEVEIIAEKNILTLYHQTKTEKRRNCRLLIIISIFSALALCIISYFIFSGIIQSLKGESYAILSNDLSSLTYYGETYVPFDIQGYSCRLGKDIVDEITLKDSTFFDKLFTEYTLQSVEGVYNDEILYLRSEHDVDFFVKKSKINYYQSKIENFEFDTAYAIFEQSDEYEKLLQLDNELFRHILSLNKTDVETSITCEFISNQRRMTIIAYNKERIFYKEYGDIFIFDNKYYWYDYANADFPDSIAYKQNPYLISDKYNDDLKALFLYYQ